MCPEKTHPPFFDENKKKHMQSAISQYWGVVLSRYQLAILTLVLA